MLLELPRPYRFQEVWAFHSRDPQGLAERVEGHRLVKGVELDGRPQLVTVELTSSGQARVSDVALASRLLGLTLDPAPFEAAFAEDPQLGPLLARRAGLRIAQAATPFEALTWAVIGQQVNLTFALALRRTFIQVAGRQHRSGLWCYPSAATAVDLDPDRLKKFSRAKAETLVRLARAVHDGELDLDGPNLAENLLEIKGVGPWTVNYTLLRGYSQPDCSLHGDAAVRKALGQAWGRPLDARESEVLLQRYRPYRSLAAAHFWAALSKEA